MGYIEDRQAEGARQAFEAAKKAEAARILDQNIGLATRGTSLGSVADVPLELSHEQVANLVLQNRAIGAKQAQEANAKATYDKLAADIFNASKAGIDKVKSAKQYNKELDGWTDGPFKDETNPVYKQFNVDRGLADKWMSSYKGE